MTKNRRQSLLERGYGIPLIGNGGALPACIKNEFRTDLYNLQNG